MAKDVLERAIERAGWTELDETSVDDFLKIGGPSVLFFTGDSSKRPEADDVAVILPELQKDSGNAFRVGVIRRDAFPALKDRFDVYFLPTLCLMHGEASWGNVARIQNWADYSEKFEAFLSEAPTQEKEPSNV